MGSICIRDTNILQTSLNNSKQSNIDDNIKQETNSLSLNIIQYNDIFIRNDTMNVNDQQWIVENREERKWHDDLIYS